MRCESEESMLPKKISVDHQSFTSCQSFTNSLFFYVDLATAKVLNKHDDKEMSLSKLWK
jgi:hypothetical protein